MAEPAFEHQVAGVANLGLGRDRRGIPSHPLLDGVMGRVEVRREGSKDVALGEDPADPAVPEHDGGSDVTPAHDGGGFGDARRGFDGHEVGAHDVADGDHDLRMERSEARALTEALRAWFRPRRRRYPWRGSTDPYAILVSEVMLQQTQAARVVLAFDLFLARYPSLRELARAPRDDVVRAWAGLGYNRRAVALSEMARSLVEDQGGRVPSDPELLRRLPGIGEYTAAAVASLAFGEPVVALDTNVRRIVARVWAGRDAQEVAPADLRGLAGWWLDREDPATWNQALMDLGREICRPRPRCEACPIAFGCRFLAEGAEPSPARRRQGRFEGSSRQVRGAVVDALRRRGYSSLGAIARCTGFSPDRIREAVEALRRDGLIEAGPAALAGRPSGRVRLAR